MMQPGIEPRCPGLLANNLSTRAMNRLELVLYNKYKKEDPKDSTTPSETLKPEKQETFYQAQIQNNEEQKHYK